MQLGIRLHDTAKCPFEERIADVHRMGFACGQLALSKLIDEFPTTDETVTACHVHKECVRAKPGGYCRAWLLSESGQSG